MHFTRQWFFPIAVASLLFSITCSGSGSKSAHRASDMRRVARAWNAQADPSPAIVVSSDNVKIGNVTWPMDRVRADFSAARAGAVGVIRPSDWPAQQSWKPMRHFGPFHFNSPHVRIENGVGHWYFRDFFTNNPNVSWYQKYFATPVPIDQFEPAPTTPNPQYVPGEFPPANSLHDMLFSLDSIAYSSMFGGSVAVTFQSIEDYEFELRGNEVLSNTLSTATSSVFESTLWDFRSVTMVLYVYPNPRAFNSANAHTIVGTSASVIITPNDPVAYTLRRTVSGPSATTQTMASTKSPEELASELTSTLTRVATSLGRDISLCKPAAQLVHGHIHNEFQTEIGNTQLVDMIELTDNFCDPHTRAGIPTVFLQMRIKHIHMGYAEIGRDELSAILAAEQIFELGEGANNPIVANAYDDMKSDDSTPYANYGAFRLLDEYDRVQGILASATIWESDPIQDNRYLPEFFNIPFHPDSLTWRYNNGVFGQVGHTNLQYGWLYESDPDETSFPDPYGGTYYLQSRVMLELR